MELRPYQLDAKRRIYQGFKDGNKSVMLQLPTGAGKTILFSSIIRDGYQVNRKCLVLAHRGELIQQAADKLYKGYGINSGIIKNGYTPNPHLPVQIASVQTLVNRQLMYPPDIVIIDEAHHMQGRNTYGKIKEMILDRNPNCKFLGVSATPCRTNGTGFNKVFDTLIQGVSMNYLIKEGFLVPPRYFVAPIDLKDVKVSAGDYNIKDLSEAFQKRIPADQLVANWKKLANNMKTIGFAVDIDHSQRIIEEYQRHGIPAAHVDGKTPENERNRTIRQFEAGEIRVLYNVGVFDEGFDLPSIEAVQLARPTKSLIKYMQMIGRALRPAEGKPFAIVLDHSGGVANHGIAEKEREWTLDGVQPRETNKVIKFKDKTTGKIYEPDRLPFNIPMENIELVELTRPTDINPERKYMGEFKKLQFIQKRKSFHELWVWYQMARQIKEINADKFKDKLNDLAVFFCKQMGYKEGRAFYMVKNYLEKNQKQAA